MKISRVNNMVIVNMIRQVNPWQPCNINNELKWLTVDKQQDIKETHYMITYRQIHILMELRALAYVINSKPLNAKDQWPYST